MNVSTTGSVLQVYLNYPCGSVNVVFSRISLALNLLLHVVHTIAAAKARNEYYSTRRRTGLGNLLKNTMLVMLLSRRL